MNSQSDALTAAKVLGHPVILRGAWLRVDSSYRYGELAPQPELSWWRLNPEARLRELANALRQNEWKPEQWRQVPYPKKGARLRHYVMPTVRDQVAFMAHMVALGPILDQQIADFAFGNRWYRPIAWDRRSERARWVHRPYPVLTNKTYLPYGRSHGLFRRVTHWTVARMTQATLPAEDDSGRAQVPEDYRPGTLPKWTGQEWWQGSTDAPRAFWAALDIELAYPSVRIGQLATAMEQALRQNVEFSRLFDGCPKPVLNALSIEDVRLEIGRRLTTALSGMDVDPDNIPQDAWGPPQEHPLPNVTDSPYNGIPTGLVISGMLLNVALLDADRIIGRYLRGTSGESRGAIVRFADDMYVLSHSREGLLSLIEVVHGALSGIGTSVLARANESSNVCINLKKIKPEPVREVMVDYLSDNGWKKCEKCKQPLPPRAQEQATKGILDWWAEKSGCEKFAARREALVRTAIERGAVGPFVTSLVERLSDMGTDTLRQRFGEGARDHLARLHELARFEIEDEQVRPDTRRMFSVNRLVRAWLPRAEDVGDEDKELRQIRETIGFVLDRTPWKFPIWRAVVRAAARRPLGRSENAADTDQEAATWLSNQLRRITCSADSPGSAAWLNAWPEVDVDDGHADERARDWRELYLSFQRGAFWRSLAEVVRELKRHSARLENGEADGWVSSPANWTTRAVADGDHAQVAAMLCRIDTWIGVLYPTASDMNVVATQWEMNEFIGAVLATHKTTELAQAWRRADGPGAVLRVPISARLNEMPRARQMLATYGRLQRTGPRRSRKLDYWALANVQLGHWTEDLGDVLFPASAQQRIRHSASNSRGAVAVGLALGCFEWVGSPLAHEAIPSMQGGSAAVRREPFVLQDYHRARSVIVGQEANPAPRATVHRLLWGTLDHTDLNNWKMAGWETPGLGLPSRIAVALHNVVRPAAVPKGWSPNKGPLTWVVDDVKGVLAAGRRGQFDLGEASQPLKQSLRVARATEWEVLPHAAFYLPFESADAQGVHMESYVLYCDVLILLTALDGTERILDSLAKWGVRRTPFVDRWSWRSRIHLPLDAWKSIERVLRWSESPALNITLHGVRLLKSFAGWSSEKISREDFRPERIDIGLPSGKDMEIVRAIRPAGELRGPTLPPELRVTDASIADELVVRVGQVVAWPKISEVIPRFPEISSATANKMIEQVSNVFLTPAKTASDAEPSFVVLPELSIPQHEVKSLRELVRDEGKGAVAGLYWRVLKPAFRPSKKGFRPAWACFVNEAELIVPVGDDRGPPAVRWFRVRKPVPAHMEDGLARALTKKANKTKWRMLSGRRWYRFVHPEWGDFTVAICADLIDAAPWRALRGDLLHLLMVAFNRDVDFFDSLTWVRAYENYINVASVNHGRFGGSFLWTPRRTHGRELARLRGPGLMLTADVRLPVKQLLWAQRQGVAKAIVQSTRQWMGKKSLVTKFKAPPPGFRGRE